jgi:hypothetical protein
LSAVSNGQTILVRAGTLQPSTRYNRSTSWATGINIFNYGTERPVLDCTNLGTGDASRILNLSGAREHWKGFEIINAKASSQAVYISGSNYAIEDCWVHDCLGDGIYIANFGSGAGNNLIQDCAVWRLGDGTTSGTNVPDCIVATGNTSTPTQDNAIVRCFVANGPDDGIDLFRGRGTRIYDSVAYDCGRYWNGASAGDGNGFKMGGGDNDSGDNWAVGCVALDCVGRGFTHNEAANTSNTNPNVVMAFCTSVDNYRGFDVGGDQSTHKNLLRDSVAFGNTGFGYVGANALELRTTNTLSITDPDFAGAASGDYSLAATSDCLGEGVKESIGNSLATQPTTGTADNLGASEVALEIAKEWLAKDLT